MWIFYEMNIHLGRTFLKNRVNFKLNAEFILYLWKYAFSLCNIYDWNLMLLNYIISLKVLLTEHEREFLLIVLDYDSEFNI